MDVESTWKLIPVVGTCPSRWFYQPVGRVPDGTCLSTIAAGGDRGGERGGGGPGGVKEEKCLEKAG